MTDDQTKCKHPLVTVHLIASHIAEYSSSPVSPLQHDLTHLYPVHKIYVRCRVCQFAKYYHPLKLPKWVQAYMETIREIEQREKREQLLGELTGQPIDLNLLDEMLDAGVGAEVLVGKIADWHGQLFPIVALQDGRIAIQVTLTCVYCEDVTTTVYCGSGLHNGAFCYVFTEDGEYQANLRDQEYVCDSCQPRAAATRERLAKQLAFLSQGTYKKGSEEEQS